MHRSVFSFWVQTYEMTNVTRDLTIHTVQIQCLAKIVTPTFVKAYSKTQTCYYEFVRVGWVELNCGDYMGYHYFFKCQHIMAWKFYLVWNASSYHTKVR